MLQDGRLAKWSPVSLACVLCWPGLGKVGYACGSVLAVVGMRVEGKEGLL